MINSLSLALGESIYFFALLWGLCIGSFLNVVIYRLPIMLKKQWADDCACLADDSFEPDTNKQVTLSYPDSSCPHCQHKIRWYENIPVISYLFLRGRCSGCSSRISLRYPCIELLTGLLTLAVIAQYGFTAWSLCVCVCTWALIALTMIDFDEMLLPDDITLPLLWGGLLTQIITQHIPLQDAVIGAMVGYLCLWSIFQGFKLLTGKEGMGYGDFKLLAALGAWVGWQKLLVIIMLSSVVGLIAALGMILLAGKDAQRPIPFGPYLAVAGWIAIMWGDTLVTNYLVMFRL